MRRSLLPHILKLECSRDLHIPLFALQILDFLFVSGGRAREVGVEPRLPDHVPPIGGFPGNEEVWLVELLREELIHSFGFFEGGGVAGVGGAVWFDEGEVGGELG